MKTLSLLHKYIGDKILVSFHLLKRYKFVSGPLMNIFLHTVPNIHEIAETCSLRGTTTAADNSSSCPRHWIVTHSLLWRCGASKSDIIFYFDVFLTVHHSIDFSKYQLSAQFPQSSTIYRVSQEEWTKLRESVPYVKIYRYNPKHLYPKLKGYGDNGQRSLKVWQLLHTNWLPNSY